MNFRGLREAGLAFMPPTYLFIGCLGLVVAIGVIKSVLAGGHPQPVHPLPAPPPAHAQITLWLFLKAFAAGCTAMTGVEAVSNGVQAFKESCVAFARRALTMIVAILIVILLGVAYLVEVYGITATEPGSSTYQSVLSLLTAAVAGHGVFYYVAMLAILLVLCLSANTSFAGFPRVCSTIARDRFLPDSFAVRGRRLVYTQRICVLAVLAAILLIAFNGVTDKLIPLFAVGAFLAFTLSQAGMVVHWLRSNDSGARVSAFINGLGSVATGITLLIVIVTKFAEGAWLIIIVIPILYFFMFSVHRHYTRIAREVAISGTINLRPPREIIAMVPVENLNALAEKALQIAYGVTDRVHVLHVKDETKDRDFASEWREYVQASLDAAKLPSATLVVIESPFRRVIAPILDYIWELERRSPDFTIVVLVPQLIEAKWYYTFMHNQRATILKTRLLLEGQNRILIVNIPWKLEKRRK
jgi:hypothetical protein